MSSFVRFLCLFAFAASSSGFTFGQTAIPMASQMPKHPAAILALAAGQNGLDSPDLKPWHLRATYQTFDETGKQKGNGVFEEWWAGPNKYKQSYAANSFTQTIYVTDTGTYKTGDTDFTPLAESLLAPRLLSPVPALDKDVVLMRRDQDFGKIKLDCVVLARKMMNLGSAPTALFPTYCFESDKPMLRFSGSYGQYNSIYNTLVIFQGRYLADDLTIAEANNVPVVHAHVEELSILSAVNDVDFTPPAGAARFDSPAPAKIDQRVMQGSLIKKAFPQYPESAKQAHIEGKVVIKAEIGEDGHVHEMTVLSAPDPSLAISSMLAVKQWEYKPYLLNGRPVRVETQITAIFKLG